MYVANAWKKTTRSKPKNDSPTTAGVGKLPAQTVTNRAELKTLGERTGWKARTLTETEIKGGMSGQELIWHQTFAPAEVEKALSTPALDKYNTEVRTKQAANRMWRGEATEEESQRAFAAGDKFATRYAQFIRSEANAKAITQYMEQNNLDATLVSDYVKAFEALVPLGKLALNPSAIGAGSETEIYDVAKHRNYHLLMQAQRRPSEIDRMSAGDFKAAAQATHPELRDNRVSPIVAARNAKAEATAQHFQQAAENTSKANVVTLTDYPDNEPSGYQTHSKFKFKSFVKNLSAVEFQEKLNDPTFVAALDRSADGNK